MGMGWATMYLLLCTGGLEIAMARLMKFDKSFLGKRLDSDGAAGQMLEKVRRKQRLYRAEVCNILKLVVASSSTLDAGSGSKDSMPDHGDDRAIGASVRVEARRGPNHILVSGQTLPSGHHARSGVSETVSCITGRSISGPVVLLEDGASMMSLSEAVMYIRCTRWSPLCTGLRLSWV